MEIGNKENITMTFHLRGKGKNDSLFSLMFASARVVLLSLTFFSFAFSLSGAVAWAQVPPVPSPGPQYENPLRAGSFEELFTNVMTGLQGIIVVLAIIFIIVGALMYITSAGNEKQMSLGKSAILAAMIGLALGIAAPSFLREIGTILGWTGVAGNPVVSGAKSLSEIASNVLKFLLSIVGILGIIMLIVGGMAYLTSAGDEGRAETGKKIVIYSIIGIAVTMVAMVLVTQIATFFTP